MSTKCFASFILDFFFFFCVFCSLSPSSKFNSREKKDSMVFFLLLCFEETFLCRQRYQFTWFRSCESIVFESKKMKTKKNRKNKKENRQFLFSLFHLVFFLSSSSESSDQFFFLQNHFFFVFQMEMLIGFSTFRILFVKRYIPFFSLSVLFFSFFSFGSGFFSSLGLNVNPFSTSCHHTSVTIEFHMGTNANKIFGVFECMCVAQSRNEEKFKLSYYVISRKWCEEIRASNGMTTQK